MKINVNKYAIITKMKFGISQNIERFVVLDSFDNLCDVIDYIESNCVSEYKIYENPGFILNESDIDYIINNTSDDYINELSKNVVY